MSDLNQSSYLLSSVSPPSQTMTQYISIIHCLIYFAQWLYEVYSVIWFLFTDKEIEAGQVNYIV